MIRKQIYPKTKRISNAESNIVVTEKLDGSNIVFFKLNGERYVATRNNIFTMQEVIAGNQYKGISSWLMMNLDKIELHEGSAICCEWIGMGQISYANSKIGKKVYMFAKANIDSEYNLKNINFNHEYFHYSFLNGNIPECIEAVPVVAILDIIPTIEVLDDLYRDYAECLGRDVEGFVICNKNSITKYVRFKNGKKTNHNENNNGNQ